MKKLFLVSSIALLSLNLAGCGQQKQHEATSNKSSVKSEKVSSKKETNSFKDNELKTKDLKLKINNEKLIQNNGTSALKLDFKIDNYTNKEIDSLMNNKLISASQEINGKEEKLEIIDNSIDSQQTTENLNNKVDKKSSTNSVMYFKVKDPNTNVKLTAYDMNGKKIGSQEVDIAKIKHVNLTVSSSQTAQSTVTQPAQNQKSIAQSNSQPEQQGNYAPNNQQNTQVQNQATQQYTEQGHYPMWKEGDVYCAQLPNGVIMRQTFEGGEDPGTYMGDPQVQYETNQLQSQWLREHGQLN